MFCKHDYEIIDKTILDSRFEQMAKNGVTKAKNLYEDMFKKKVIIILKCKKCNKINKIIETN